MFVTIALAVSIYFRYDIWLKYKKSLGKYDQSDTLYNTGYYRDLISELILVMLSPYPFFNRLRHSEILPDWDNFEIVYEINDVLLLFSFIRIYLVARYVLFQTGYLDGRSQRICKHNGAEANIMFAIKGFINQQPTKFLAFSVITLMFVFAYQLRMFEA